MRWRSALLVILIISLTVLGVSAGSSGDVGTVSTTPPIGQVNWIAWLGDTNPPAQVLTEDSTSPGTGVDQGYQDFGSAPNPKWVLQVSQFNNPPPTTDVSVVTILLGGLGASSGTGWQTSFTWSSAQPVTDHGQVSALGSFAACPVMTQGSQDGTGKVINWTGAAGTYHIYRSQNASGAGNGASDGRYNYVATVTAPPFTYTDTTCVTGVSCWHIVVPANQTTNAITGCHSEESNPTSVTFSSFRAAGGAGIPLIWAGLVLPLAAAAGLVLYRRRKPGA